MTAARPPSLVVRQRLEALMRHDEADAMLGTLMYEAGLSAIESADDQLRVAEVLIRRRGALAALGRALKIDAYFAGANDQKSRG